MVAVCGVLIGTLLSPASC